MENGTCRPEGYVRQCGVITQMASDIERDDGQEPCARGRGAYLHHQLPNKRLLLRLPIHRLGKQQRHRRYGGLE